MSVFSVSFVCCRDYSVVGSDSVVCPILEYQSSKNLLREILRTRLERSSRLPAHRPDSSSLAAVDPKAAAVLIG
uniref:Uncharacterized protein n=1 Tax=Sander lucioperca TaxID=283035 RepID=A0A8C9XXV2_SANLU